MEANRTGGQGSRRAVEPSDDEEDDDDDDDDDAIDVRVRACGFMLRELQSMNL